LAKKHEVLEHIMLLLEAIPTAITLYDHNEVIIDCNMKTVKLFGFTDKTKFIKEFNERYFDFSPKCQPCGTLSTEKKEEAFRQVHSHGRFQVEWMHLDVNGKELPISATLAKIEIEDTHLILICDMDLREIRLARAKETEAKQRLFELEIETLDHEKKFKETILTTLSHEMRTPLAVMSVYAEVAIDKIQSGETAESVLTQLAIISDEAHRLAELAMNTMDTFVKKSEKDDEEIIDIGKKIAYLSNMLVPMAKKRDITIIIDLPECLPAVRGKVSVLTRVVWNIFENALRYTQEGGTITAFGKDDSEYVSITIADTGCGMTHEIKTQVYERGFSNDNMTGLGLPFCKEIIEAHGGEISIESEPGNGCAVTFTLPKYES